MWIAKTKELLSPDYGLALLSTVIVILLVQLTLSLNPVASAPIMFLLFLTAVAVSGWYGGLGPGLAATFLSALAGAYILIDRLDFGLLVVFLLEAGLISGLMANLRAALDRARAGEARFRVALEHSPITVFNQDRELRFTWIHNPTPPWDPGAAIGKTEGDFVSPEDAERLVRLKRNVLESGAGVRAEVPLTVRGETVVVDLTAEPLRDPAGRVVGVTVVAVNITARRRAEDELRRLAAIVENANDAIVGTALDGTIVSWNPAAQRMFGYAAEEILGRPFSLLVPPERTVEAPWLAERIRQAERVEQFETVRLRKDGTPIYVSVTLSPVADAAGQIVGASRILRDITARQAAEARLTYQAWLLANVNDAIVASDETFRLTAWNAAAEALYGWTAEEVLGKRGLDIVSTEFADVDKAEVFRRLAETGHYRGEATQARKDGRRVPVEVASTVLRDADGRVIGYASVNRDVAERKRAEAALRASEARHRAVLTAIPDLLLRIRRDGVFIDVVTAKEVKPLVPREAFVGKTIAQVMPEAVARQSMDHLRAAFETGATQVFDYPLQVGGEERHYEARLVVSGEDEAVAMVRDITARRRAEAALRESEARFRAMADAMPQLVWTARADGAVDYYNRRIAEFDGIRQAEDGRWEWQPALHPDDAEPTARAWQTAVATGTPFEIEHRVRRADGSFAWFVSRAVPERDAPGRVVKWYGTATDIDALKRAEAALAAETERLVVTLRSIGDGVIATDTAGGVVLMNRVAERLTGWTQAEAAGLGVGDVLRLVHEVTREPLPNPARQALATGQTVALANHAAAVSRGGDERLVADSAAPIRDEGGRVLGAVMVLADVTQQRRAEEEMAKVSKLESIGVLAGGIAHDFNNLLTAILANVSLARLEHYPREKAAQRLDEAETACRRAADVAQRLLTFARGGDPVRKPTALAGLLREYTGLGLMGSATRAEFHLAPDLWPVEADAGQIGQVIQNLALNAQQAMPAGGTVTVRGENLTLSGSTPLPLVAGPYVRIAVSDHGAGIPPEAMPRIFDPFFTTKPHGHGLGLSVAFSIVRKHGGHLVAESTPGTGTTFFVYLPAIPGGVSAGESAPTERRESPTEGRARVLVMDDEAHVREVVEAILSALGYEVAAAGDGMDAVALYRQARAAGRPFDAVILDLTVPGGMGGLEALQRLRALDPGVRALVSSGYADDPILIDYREHGFRGVVAKPYTVDELGRAIRRVLESAPGDSAGTG